MPKYTSNRIDLNVGFNVDKSGLDKVKQAFQQIQNIKPGQFQGTEAQLRKIQTQAKQVQKALSTAFNAKIGTVNLQTFQAELKKSETSINQVYAGLSRLGGVGQAAFAKMSSSILSTNLQLKETHGLLQSFGNTMLNTIKWGFASSIINGFTSSIQQAVSYVEGLDKSLTNIRIVTGDSREEMSKFAEEANRAAQSLGRSTMDYTKAALSYYQQGLSDEQVAARTEATLKAQNITGAGQEMADYLTAVWNGYKVVNDEAELYVDKMAAVADSSASNMAQLATAMSKVASTANMMGVDMDQLNAQIATIVATTRQAPESVGNALKTIYTRINDIKTGSDDAQISLGNYTSKMAQLGVNVLDASGNLRDTGEVIEQIGGKWDTMSREQQIYLSRTMAGQRQINNLLALFDNWSRYSDLVNISMQSQGTTMQKNSRYMESLGAHLNQLNAAQQRFKSSMIDSDSFKNLVDVGTGFTKLGAELIEAIGGGGTALLALGSIATQVFSGIISKEIASSVINVQTFKNNLNQIAEVEKQVKIASEGALNQGLSKQYLADLRAMTSAWRGLSDQQKKIQHQRASQLNDLRSQKAILEDQVKIADKLSVALTKKTTGQLQEQGGIKNLSVQLQAYIGKINQANQAFKNFALSGDQGNKAIVNSYKDMFPILEQVASKLDKTDQQLIINRKKLAQSGDTSLIVKNYDALVNELGRVLEKAGLSAQALNNIGKTKTSLDSLTSRIRQLGDQFKAVNEQGIQINKIQSFVKIGSAVGQLTAGISGAVNAFKALKNESLSTGQKVLQFLSGFGMSIGMVVSGFRSLAPLMATAIVNLGAVTSLRSADAAATFVETAANQGLFAAIKAQNAQYKEQIVLLTLIKLLRNPVFWGIAAAVVATTIAVKELYDAWTADARAAQQAAQNAAAASQAYDKVKESANQLKSSLEEYNSFQDTLTSLTRGTEEWNQAIQQSNELVLDLINKFPELAEQVKNVNGQLVLDQDAIETVQQNMNKQVQAASLNKAYAAAVSRDASITSQATDLGRQFSRQASNINATPVNISGQQMKIIAQELNKFEAGQLEDIGIDQLNDHLATEAQVSLDVIEAIRNEETGIKQLQNAIRQNTNATKLQYEALAANSEQLQNSTAYQNGSDIQKRLMQSITASDLENATDSLADQWQNTLTNIDRLSDARNQDWSQQVLDAVSASVGQQLNWATNSIRGMGQNRQFVFLDENNKEITRRADQIASMIAATEALNGLSESVTNASEVISKIEKYQFSPDSSKEQNQAIRTAIQEYIGNQNFDNVSKGILQQLKGIDITTAFGFSDDELKAIAEANDTTVEQLKEDFQDLAQSTIDSFGKAFEQLPNILSTQVQEAISDEDLTVGSEKAVVDNVKNAIANGGKEAYQELLSIYEDMDNVDGFEKVVSDLDLSNTSVQQLSQKLKEAGVETGLTNDQLAKYIELMKQQGDVISPEQNYANIHQIVDGLKAGDTVDPQQAETLKAAGVDLDAFFTHMADGSYKLKTDAQEFYDYVNQISLQPFVDQIKTSTQHLRQLTSLQEGVSDYSYEDLSSRAYTETGRRSVQVDSDLLNAQLDTLQALDIDGMQQKIVAYQEELQEYGKLSTESMEEVYQAIKDNASAFSKEGLAERIKAENQIIQDNLQQLRNSIPTDEDVDVQAMYALRDALMQNNQLYEETLEPSERLSQDLQDNAWAAEDVAQSILRYDAALATLQQNYDDWLDILENGSMQQQAELFDELANAYGDLLDMDGSQLSSDFVNNADNLRLFQEAANGSEEAYNQLLQAAGQDIAGKVYLDTNQFYVDRDAIYQSLYDLTGQQWDDIQVGAILDDTNFIAGLQNMINAAHMTADQATSYLASMGVDAQVIEDKQSTDQVKEQTGWVSTLQPYTNWGSVPIVSTVGGVTTITDVPTKYMTMNAIYTPTSQSVTDTKENSAFSLKVISAKKSSGGNFKFKKASHGGGSAGRKARSGGGGGKKGSGGSGSTPKAATQAKLNTSKIETKTKTAQTNPYQQQQKAFQRQEKILDNLQNKQKKLVNKDRLKNLKDQNKTLEEQVKILNKELDISKNQAAENSTANYAKRLKDAFGSVLRFDSDGQISDINALERASVNTYNTATKAAADAFEKQKAKYNDYITNTWNKYSTQEQQEANKTEKEYWDQRVKNAEEAAKKAISAAQEEYKTREDLIKSYNSAWEADQDRLEKIRDLQDQIIENRIAISKITVDLSIDTGQAERDWLEFEKKFIKKIDNDDFLGQAKASVKELMSYFNSKQVQQTANQIKKIQNQIAVMEKGAVSSIYGDNLAQAKEDLEDYMKQQMSDLQDVQDLVDDIKDNYLDAIDSAKDKMDQQIDQYERVNDLVEHNVKLTELLYGDKAYATMDKYYDLIQKNNEKELDSLRKQQEYWQERMNQQVVGSDAWQQFKKNLDDATDSLNDKLEEIIDDLAKKWQNKVDGIIEKLNNGLTEGRGLDYLDEQWDYINNFDDNFLDTVNSVMGTRDVERLYQQAIDNAADSPKQQQRINKLMNEQLKILKEKNKLTEYDIERAKALLQVEQARMALEDARNAKTKMRLRRDSQGNYTYQYVADEQKLSELQAALDDAQTNLYNQDKEHYKQNLNELYDTYKDYIDKMKQLTQEYNQTQDEEERARIQARMDLLKQSTNQLMQGLTQDNEYALRYLNQSFFDAMQIDASNFTAEEQMEIMNQNIPQMKSNIQDLANQIVGQGGILNATADAMAQINKATQKYDADVKNMLENAGTSLQIVSQAVDGSGNALDKNIQNAENFITANDKLIEACDAQIKEIQLLMDWLDKYLNKVMNVESLVANLRNAYGADQRLNGSNLTADNISVENVNLDTTAGMEYTGNPATDAAKVKSQIDLLLAQYEEFLKNMTIATFDTGGATGTWADAQGRLAFLHQKELVLNAADTENILRAVDMVRNMTNSLSGFANNELNDMMTQAVGMLGGINTNSTLDQNVHIDASFPNVREHTEIEQAFENLVNMASMHASGYRD